MSDIPIAPQIENENALSRHAVRGAIWSVLTNALAAPLNLIATGFALEQLGREWPARSLSELSHRVPAWLAAQKLAPLRPWAGRPVRAAGQHGESYGITR